MDDLLCGFQIYTIRIYDVEINSKFSLKDLYENFIGKRKKKRLTSRSVRRVEVEFPRHQADQMRPWKKNYADYRRLTHTKSHGTRPVTMEIIRGARTLGRGGRRSEAKIKENPAAIVS